MYELNLNDCIAIREQLLPARLIEEIKVNSSSPLVSLGPTDHTEYVASLFQKVLHNHLSLLELDLPLMYMNLSGWILLMQALVCNANVRFLTIQPSHMTDHECHNSQFNQMRLYFLPTVPAIFANNTIVQCSHDSIINVNHIDDSINSNSNNFLSKIDVIVLYLAESIRFTSEQGSYLPLIRIDLRDHHELTSVSISALAEALASRNNNYPIQNSNNHQNIDNNDNNYHLYGGLKVLLLSNTSIQDRGVLALSQILLPVYPSLQTLVLSQCKMTPLGAKYLAEALLYNTGLMKLVIEFEWYNGIFTCNSTNNNYSIDNKSDDNSIDIRYNVDDKAIIMAEVAEAWTEMLENNYTLEELSIESSLLIANDGLQMVSGIASGLRTNTTLTHLTFIGTSTSSSNATNQNQTMTTMTNIEDRRANDTKPIHKTQGSKLATALSTFLTVNTSLKYVTINDLDLGDDGVSILAAALSYVEENLEDAKYSTSSINFLHLNLDRTNFHDRGIVALCDVLAHPYPPHSTNTNHTEGNNRGNSNTANDANQFRRYLRPIQVLSVKGNFIADIGAVALASALSKNNTLQDIYLTHNQIHNRGAVALAKALHINQHISIFQIKHNPLSLDLSSVMLNNVGWCCSLFFPAGSSMVQRYVHEENGKEMLHDLRRFGRNHSDIADNNNRSDGESIFVYL